MNLVCGRTPCRPYRDSVFFLRRTPDLRPGLMNGAASRLRAARNENGKSRSKEQKAKARTKAKNSRFLDSRSPRSAAHAARNDNDNKQEQEQKAVGSSSRHSPRFAAATRVG